MSDHIGQYDFIHNSGLNVENSLTHLIDSMNTDIDEEINMVEHSRYYNDNDFIDTLQTQQSILSILNLNCQSLNAKFDQLQLYISKICQTAHIDVITLQETWFDDNVDISYFELDNFDVISLDRRISKHGGLLIYINKQYSHKTLDLIPQSDVFEGLFLEIQDKQCASHKYIIGNLYRPPHNVISELDTFIDEFTMITNTFQSLHLKTYLCADFNIDLLKLNTNHKSNLFYENVTQSGFFPKITMPTRLASITLIDNILTNNIDCSHTSGVLARNISDHQICFTIVNDRRRPESNTQQRLIEIERSDPESFKKFENNLMQTNIYANLNKDIHSDPNENCNLLVNTIMKIKSTYMPCKIVKFNKRKHKDQPWMTNKLLKQVNKKTNLYIKLKQTPKLDRKYNTLKKKFKAYERTVKNNIQKTKREYYQNVFTLHKNNVKKTWHTIKETLNKYTKIDTPSEIVNENITYDKEQDIADQFNNFFANIGSRLSNQIDNNNVKPYTDYLTNHTDTTFDFTLITEEIIINIINKLPNKKSCGTDNISNKLLKKIKHFISGPLTLIVNQCLTTGIFPDNFKVSKIIPIYKKDDRKLLTNYRPISLLPTMSKIIERIMHGQLYNYFNDNNLIAEQQYGFRKNHSTELAALKLSDHNISEMDRGNIPIAIFLDLSKAFDTLNHDILLKKLRFYGVKDSAHKLIDHYLRDRQQYVKIGDCQSNLIPISTGIPQGSILGPLFFSIYINDLPTACDSFKFIMYADDTTLYANIENFDQNDIDNEISQELEQINNWLAANKLSLNVKKSKFMLFHKLKQVPTISIQINNVTIDRVSHFNYLGITFDEHLSWENHINMISIKISKIIGIINRLKFVFPQRILFTLYNSLLLPHFFYGILLWGYCADRVVKLQKRAIRTISFSKPLDHTEPLFKTLNLLKLEDIYVIRIYKFYHKLSNNNLPSYFDEYKMLTEPITRRYSTRCTILETYRVKNEYAKCCLKYQLISLLNMVRNNNGNDNVREGNIVPQQILTNINTLSYLNFSKHISQYMINLYKHECIINNCFICNGR